MTTDKDLETEFVDFTFTKSRSTYRRPTTIHHWQLRDLISAADSSEDSFYCVHDHYVYRYNAKTQQSTVVSNLDWAANSMTCRLGFLAAGGLHGELEVHDLVNSELVFKGIVGRTVNNALHIAAHGNGEKRLFVCTNDSTIMVYKLPSMESVCVIRCPQPVNYTALSPDGNFLVTAVDQHQTYVYQATPQGYTLLASFTEACDVGMCCAWNHHGGLFGSCHQDGTVAVWDQRSGACVMCLTLPTAARCMKFSCAPLDLLAVSEHEDRVTLLDARKWGSKQVLNLGAPDTAAGGAAAGVRRQLDVSGIAFTPSGQRLWVGLEECCMSYDIDSLKRRTFGVANIL